MQASRQSDSAAPAAGSAAAGGDAAGPPAAKGRAGSALLAAALGVFFGSVAAFLPALLNDGDTFYHIRAGQLMLADHHVLVADPFSATMGGHPWHVHEWLAEVAFALAFDVAGLAGVMLLTGAAIGGAAALLARSVGRHVGPVLTIAVVVLALTVAGPFLLARPHILVLPLLVAWCAEVLDAAASGRRPSWWLLPLMWLWANMHGTFLIGLAVAGIAGLEALERAGRSWPSVLASWMPLGLATVVVTVLGPHGLTTILFPFQHSASAFIANIGEWHPVTFDHFSAFEVALAVLLIALAQGMRVPTLRLVALLGLLHMSLSHERHQLLLAMIGPLLLAPSLSVLDTAPTGPEAAPRRPGASPWAFALAFAVVAAAALRLAIPAQARDGFATPVSALAALPAGRRDQAVLNDYAFGGFLIYQGYRPYVDSRAELYGDPFLADYLRLSSDRCRLADVLRERDIGWTIFSTENHAAVQMDTLPGWRRIYADPVAVVHAREGGAMPAPPDCR